ncbi:hypothetical protein KIL84_011453 [Mauremys mutica]|uniref:Uncharacterized protein n=1 Tax=Mauremys mutica TaxID=74926 RepID=A0A9D4B2C0_9SAUR|nr:hypothetical protein KIL84_011453 [Mauremys mutica]
MWFLLLSCSVDLKGKVLVFKSFQRGSGDASRNEKWLRGNGRTRIQKLIWVTVNGTWVKQDGKKQQNRVNCQKLEQTLSICVRKTGTWSSVAVFPDASLFFFLVLEETQRKAI